MGKSLEESGKSLIHTEQAQGHGQGQVQGQMLNAENTTSTSLPVRKEILYLMIFYYHTIADLSKKCVSPCFLKYCLCFKEQHKYLKKNCLADLLIASV